MKGRGGSIVLTSVSGMLIAAALACGGSAGQTNAPIAAPTEASGVSSSGGGIADIDPCQLMAQSDATSFFNVQANPGVKNAGSTSASCSYTSSQNGDLLTLNVLYEDGAARDSNDYMSLRTTDAQTFPGVGDDAYYNKAFYQLTVAKGHWIFTLNGSKQGTNAGSDSLAPLANAVLPRLPQ